MRIKVGEISFGDPGDSYHTQAEIQFASNVSIGLQGWLDSERSQWIKENSRDVAFVMNYYIALDEWVLVVYAWFEPEVESFFALKWANLSHEDQ